MTPTLAFSTHELFIVMNENFLLVYLQEFASQAAQNVPCASGVAQSKHIVWLIQGWLGAVADLEALGVPMDHVELLLKFFDVSVYVRNLNVSTADNDPCSEVESILRFRTLLYQLVLTIKSIQKRLVNVSGLNLWIDQVIQRRKTALQKMLLWKWDQIHCDLVHIHIEVALKSHRACHIVDYICHN